LHGYKVRKISVLLLKFIHPQTIIAQLPGLAEIIFNRHRRYIDIPPKCMVFPAGYA